MLLIALALQSATMAPPAIVAAAPRIMRATLRRSARPAPSPTPLLSACRTANRCDDRNALTGFRVTAARAPLIDRKLEMIHAAEGPSCGLTGMPVCPARGRRILQLAY
ncbi:hypothetical protein [Sphingomonas pokkalii]|uniref:hypothetical protein n=1 Tax=Sphingomonas pokkalii TaxID=2175090 RepID=UPI0014036E13|nr:hypothetical protein [Sphingomonas pokkalii]